MYKYSIDYTPVQNQSGNTISISVNDDTIVSEPLAHTCMYTEAADGAPHPFSLSSASQISDFPLFIRNTCKLLREVLQ